jgi:stearoyl-CoA desaturase (delta-9 desaturase)
LPKCAVVATHNPQHVPEGAPLQSEIRLRLGGKVCDMNELMSVWSALVDWLAHGLWSDATWWQIVLVTLVMTHFTICGVTIFLHRAQAHRALELHAIPSHFFRFWLWLTTGMVTKEFVAVHRKHHAKCETEEDPHSPQTRGIKALLLTGVELYRAEAKNPETLAKYGKGTPDDWIERNLYTRYSWQGVGLMLIIDLLLFGAIGLTIWAIQMAWIPVWATGVINGIGQVLGQALRVRHRLGLHPRNGNGGPGQAAQDRAAAEAGRDQAAG